MAKENSFDIVSTVDLNEVGNAVDQTMREVRQRFDFKGSSASVELKRKEMEIVCLAEDSFKLKSLIDILDSKTVKRGVSLKFYSKGKVEDAAGSSARMTIKILDGIDAEKAKEIVKLIKSLKLKVNASILEDKVRVAGKKIDDLQSVIDAVKERDFGIFLKFENMRG